MLDDTIKNILNQPFDQVSKPDWERIEKAVENGELLPEDVPYWNELVRSLVLPEELAPSDRLDRNFYAWLDQQPTQNLPSPTPVVKMIRSWTWAAVAASLLLCGGVALGLLIGKQNTNQQLTVLNTQVKDLKEMMSLNLMQSQISTSDRLKGVQLVNDLPEASTAVVQALLITLNEDDNTNVRLAALESLVRFADQPEVRTALIAAIAKQTSPLVQIALADVMKAYQVAGSLNYFKKSWEVNQMPGIVKDEIEHKLIKL